MCRKKQLQGWCIVSFGLGLMLGYAIESWLLCSAGGLLLIFFGLLVTRQRG